MHKAFYPEIKYGKWKTFGESIPYRIFSGVARLFGLAIGGLRRVARPVGIKEE